MIRQKPSFGTQSAAGSRFVERLLTVLDTCRRRERNVIDWPAQAVEAKLRRPSAPSLLVDA